MEQRIRLLDWQRIGLEHFGSNPMLWEFVCPVCGLVQRPQDFRELGMPDSMIQRIASYSCIGRWKRTGCDYTGSQMQSPLVLELPDGGERPVFNFNIE